MFWGLRMFTFSYLRVSHRNVRGQGKLSMCHFLRTFKVFYKYVMAAT